MTAAFKLLPKSSRQEPDIIVNAAGTLRIDVRPLMSGLKQSPGVVYLYGDDRGDAIVFAVSTAGDLEADAAAAIKWYAREWLFHPTMDINILMPTHLLN